MYNSAARLGFRFSLKFTPLITHLYIHTFILIDTLLLLPSRCWCIIYQTVLLLLFFFISLLFCSAKILVWNYLLFPTLIYKLEINFFSFCIIDEKNDVVSLYFTMYIFQLLPFDSLFSPGLSVKMKLKVVFKKKIHFTLYKCVAVL